MINRGAGVVGAGDGVVAASFIETIPGDFHTVIAVLAPTIGRGHRFTTVQYTPVRHPIGINVRVIVHLPSALETVVHPSTAAHPGTRGHRGMVTAARPGTLDRRAMVTAARPGTLDRRAMVTAARRGTLDHRAMVTAARLEILAPLDLCRHLGPRPR
jgi:hypothetical protein